MLSILSRWNKWGTAKLASGYPRDVLEQIKLFLDSKEVVALIGLRRSGKSTVLYQLMDLLENAGVPQKAMFHMNFEEPAIAPSMRLNILDEIYQTYREEVYPIGKAYLFFDEIQNVPEWERWVRARNESEEVKIFITGSSAHLMSRELATVLTGRHVEFYITPLSFMEMLRFKNIAAPDPVLKSDPPPAIQHALLQYMTWGGFPEVVLSDNEEKKRILLRQYFDDILFKDIAMRHQIRDVTVLRNIAVHLLTHTACLFSFNRIAKIFEISLEMAANYCYFIQEAFLVDYLSFFSLKTAERTRNPQKIYVCDLGLRQIASISTSPDYGKLAETLVYQHLQRAYKGNIFYWKGKQEIDFVIRNGNEIQTMIQVAYQNLDQPEIFKREINAIEEAEKFFCAANSYLIAGKLPQLKYKKIVPLWNVLLNSSKF